MDEPAPPPLLPRALPEERPSAWPSLLAPVVAGVAATFVGGVTIAGVTALSGSSSTDFPASAVLILTVQFTLLATSVSFASMERERPARRLGFVRWKNSSFTVGLAVLGTLGVQFLLDLVASHLIDEPSESLKQLNRMFLEPEGLAAVGVGFLISVLPGLCEETLFRGFTQRGLMRCWSPFASIGVTSILFAAMHMDVQHSLLVLPLGAWIGFVAWRTGSVWPAILCHFVNNLAAFVYLRLWGDPETIELPDAPAFYVVGAALVACAVLATVKLGWRRATGR